VIVPFVDVVPTPFSLKTRAAGDGVEAGVVTELGDGEGEVPVPVLPQPAAVIRIAARTTDRLVRANPLQLCTRALPVKVT